ncbi:hypothetical protein [Hymenobacter metallicola]|uniref:DUF4177 domain-containing protein n=1 Tax=Hymenobacter metallicola TaxID=2563114 RepID=A0A4Z0Q217_9BACT|nr:hypothetical protein [Hymenobacter metallicola]TGE23539.1 hypothetical protein E5K02_20350 [Hymenobacter metallicola]
MYQDELPDYKQLIFFATSTIAATGQRTIPVPYTEAEVLADAQVQEWLAKGYEVESFYNKVTTNDPYALLVEVNLCRTDIFSDGA